VIAEKAPNLRTSWGGNFFGCAFNTKALPAQPLSGL